MRPTPPRRLPRSAIVGALAAALVLTAGVPIEAATAVKVAGVPGCRIFPSTNVWNKRVDSLPVRTDSETLKAAIGLNAPLHPDFGSYSGYGIPWNVVSSSTPRRDRELPVAATNRTGSSTPSPRSPASRPAATATCS